MSKSFPIKIIEGVISRIKSEDYSISPDLSFRDLVSVISYRGWQVLRGMRMVLRFKKIKAPVFAGKKIRIYFGHKLSAGKGLIIEDNVTINALSKDGIILENNVTIASNSVLQATGVVRNLGKGIKIGSNSAVGSGSFLGGQGGIEIGDNVIMGPAVKIFSENHNFDSLDNLIKLQGETRKGVKIKDNCWIGSGVIILDGVEIGSGVVVAAGSVVTKSLPDNCIAAGIPAKIISYRGKQ